MSMIKELIASSLAFEQAFTMAGSVQREITPKKYAKLSDGGKLLYDDLDELKSKYRAQADAGWKKAEAAAKVSDDPYQNLANAIVERAVLDYEIALSQKDEAAQHAIEDFAAGEFCAELTKLNVSEQLEVVKARAYEYFKLVRVNYKRISQDSANLRKAGKPLERYGKYRCPLCGGRLYEYQRAKRRKEYHCSGCALVGYEP